jgi:hypothetical protein
MLQNLKASFQSAYHTILSKKYLNLLFLVISITLIYFISFQVGFVFLLLSVTIINNFSPKMLVALALFFLICVPVFLIFDQEVLAEKIAVYVYYLLIGTIFVELILYLRNRKLKRKASAEKEHNIVENAMIESENTNTKTVLQLTEKRVISMEFQRPLTINQTVITSKKPEIAESPKLAESPVNKALVTKKLFSDLNIPQIEDNLKSRIDIFNLDFNAIKIFDRWNYIVVFLSALLPIWIFRFTGLPSFRDLTTVPYVYNIQNGPFDLGVIEGLVFNQFTRLTSPENISSLFFQTFFFFGTILTYFFLLRIQAQFSTSLSYLGTKTNKVLIFLISLLYVYNPFTFERFLMGQHFMLRGHLLFIPIVFYLLDFLGVFANFKNPNFNLLSEKNIGIFSNFGWALTLISLISTHHGVFVIYLLVAGIVFISLSNFKPIIKFFKKSTRLATLNNIFKLFSVLLLVVLPSVIIFVNRYGNSPQQATYNKQKIEYPDTQRRIISAFSLKVLGDQNLVEKALIGAASWNTPSFSEVNGIAIALGNTKKLSIYYSPKLNLLLIIFMVVIIGYCAYLADKFYKQLLFPFLVLLPLLLILNFGYSGNFESINSLFFNLPFSYTFRESGKFYSLFLALLSIILVTYSEYFINRFRKISIGVFTFLLIGNLLTFLPLSQNIVYADYPQILKDVSSNCKRSDKTKVLFLPFNNYIYPSYSNVFTANYSKSLLNCEVIAADYTTLENREPNNKISDTIELSNTRISNSINGIINTFTKSNATDTNAYENLRKDLRIFGVYTVIIDETNYSDTSSNDLGVFNKKLQQYILPDNVEKNENISISVYTLK